jgi:hypothetical protein
MVDQVVLNVLDLLQNADAGGKDSVVPRFSGACRQLRGHHTGGQDR